MKYTILTVPSENNVCSLQGSYPTSDELIISDIQVLLNQLQNGEINKIEIVRA